MFKKLKELLQGVITKTSSQQSAVEQFVVSKNPTSVAEVEHWVKVFDRQGGRNYGF